MDYHDIVNNAPEIVGFCECRRLLDGKYVDAGGQSLVIYDSAEAMAISAQEMDGYEFWPGLCESEYVKLDFDCPHWLSRRIDRLLVTPLRERTDDNDFIRLIPIIWDAVQADVLFCMANKNSKIQKKLFLMIQDAYIASGWPCGWKGKFPEGKLVVFSKKEAT